MRKSNTDPLTPPLPQDEVIGKKIRDIWEKQRNTEVKRDEKNLRTTQKGGWSVQMEKLNAMQWK